MLDLTGQTVAVVGNASSILLGEHGPEIDGHDLVLRMNRGLPTDPTKQGSRTDILVFSVFVHIRDIYKKFGAKTLVCMSPRNRQDVKIDCEYYDLDRWEKLHEVLGHRPSVGAMTLDMISTANAAGVTLYGYDFKRSPTLYNNSLGRGQHDFRAEEAFCKAKISELGWKRRVDKN